jgi:transglutaminase-like putative cysteine protease
MTQPQDVGSAEVYLAPTRYIDCDSAAVRDLAAAAIGGRTDPVERAAALYLAVRDGIRYDPYSLTLKSDDFVASAIIGQGRGYCVAKAIVLTAAARACGIPARIGFADVRNHLATERLRRMMRTDLFMYHGYCELRLDGKWVKATPAFNLELCEKFGVAPLEFDGRTDSIFHPFDTANHRHMEYVRDHGTFDDVPVELLAREMRAHYPHIFRPEGAPGGAAALNATPGGDFMAEALAESK